MTDEVSRNERIKEASDYLRGSLAEGLREEITGAIVEDDQQLVKFHGMYLQDDRDLRSERTRKKMEKAFAFMIRVRIPGGVLNAAQWLALDSGRARLRQRHHAAHHAADRATARRHQVESEGDAEGNRRGAAQFDRRLRRRQPQCHVRRQSRSGPRACRGARSGACRLRPPDAANAGLSRDLARRREDRRRRGRCRGADLRQDLSAAQIQDRGGGAAVERCRYLRARSRLHRHPRRQRRRGRLERDGRRRDGHDPRRGGHLSAHRRCHGILQDRRRREDRRSGGHRAARLGRPGQPQARTAEIHHRRPWARFLPRRGGAPFRRGAGGG